MNKKVSKYLKLVAVMAFAVSAVPTFVLAQSTSPNYRVEESYFGSGGQTDASSSSYRARQSTGALGVGDASSANYRATSGFDTPSAPFLEVVVTDAFVNLGTLSDATPSYGSAQAGDCNCSFTVRSYLSSDYSVVTASDPPTSENNDSLDTKTTQGAPSTSTNVEEFGINVVDNTTPDIGANPVNQPDSTFADGVASTGYDIPDNYKYLKGDTIARSPATVGNQGVGQTDFTVTYMAKASSITPAGYYVMRHEFIVVPTF